MALFGDNAPTSLEEILGQRAESEGMNIEQQFAKKRRQSVAQQAHQGRLGSGVANYQAADLGAEELGAYGDLESSLAETLGAIPADDYVASQEFERQRELAKLIGKLNNRKSLLGGIIGGASSGAQAGSVGGPWGALGGGITGAISGGVASNN
jgi:hypothetical protein